MDNKLSLTILIVGQLTLSFATKDILRSDELVINSFSKQITIGSLAVICASNFLHNAAQ
ncbi:hypothetical protein GCM10009431_07960 [Gaetbulibacter jejuensis]|uniref:Uncharacterized protein n=1 Tax=Gaetbulibacter jejuensis TaxID=584607 RepID=A0ABN1JGD1_9FLAO